MGKKGEEFLKTNLFPRIRLSIIESHRNVQNIFLAKDVDVSIQVFQEILVGERVLKFVAHPPLEVF